MPVEVNLPVNPQKTVRKRGAWKWELKPEYFKLLEELGERCTPQMSLGAHLGVNKSHWFELKKRYPELNEAYQRGRAKSQLKDHKRYDNLVDRLEKNGKEGLLLGALQYKFDRIHGYAQNQQLTDGNININVSLKSSNAPELTDKNVQIIDVQPL